MIKKFLHCSLHPHILFPSSRMIQGAALHKLPETYVPSQGNYVVTLVPGCLVTNMYAQTAHFFLHSLFFSFFSFPSSLYSLSPTHPSFISLFCAMFSSPSFPLFFTFTVPQSCSPATITTPYILFFPKYLSLSIFFSTTVYLHTPTDSPIHLPFHSPLLFFPSFLLLHQDY